MMSLKACCGLLASRDDEDHDYEDDGEPLPKPQTTAEHLKSVQGSMTMSPDSDLMRVPESLFIRASISESTMGTAKSDSTLPSTRSKGISPDSERWSLGLPPSTSTTPSNHVESGQGFDGARNEALLRRSISPVDQDVGSVGFGGRGSGRTGSVSNHVSENRGHVRAGSRNTATVSPSLSRGGGRNALEEPAVIERGIATKRRASSPPALSTTEKEVAPASGQARVIASRTDVGVVEAPATFLPISTGSSNLPRGRVLTHTSSGRALHARDRSGHVSMPASKVDLAAFVSKLKRGVLLTKINRQGKAKVRTLFYDEQNKVLWWNEPGAAARGGPRHRSSSLLSLRKEQPLPVAKLLDVRMASQLDTPFCFQGDVDKSFQLVFPNRTVDLVAKDEEEATLLAKGFQELNRR